MNDLRRPIRIQFPQDTRPQFVEVAMIPPVDGEILFVHDREAHVDTQWRVTGIRTVIDIDGGNNQACQAVTVVAVERYEPKTPSKRR